MKLLGNRKLFRENQNLIDSTDRLKEENTALREQADR